jgi:hypothetical protein
VPEPVRIGVSDLRRAIYSASGFAKGDGAASTDVLGGIFHRVFEFVIGAGSANAGDPELLRRMAYEQVIGQSLHEHQAGLQGRTAETLAMWAATGHLCAHVAGLLAEGYVSAEEELTWLVEDRSWRAPVLVSGVADGIWRDRGSKRWRALELKLGAGSSGADIAQLCLYHAMVRSHAGGAPGEAELLHFQPELKREKFTEEQLEPIRGKLVALIGKLAGVTPEIAYRDLGARLVRVLEEFGPMVTLESDPAVGPSFLRFHIKPAPGVKVNKILPLGADIAAQLRLAWPAMISFEEGALVVDIQRPDRELLLFSQVRHDLPCNPTGNSEMLVGMDLKRQLRFASLASSCPHILVAGTTGSGKSEWLRTALASLIATNTPETLRVVLIDPKRVAFGAARKSPFLLYPNALLFTAEESISGFDLLTQAMEMRYALFEKHQCVDLDALRRKLPNLALPRIVLFCDEYGNLVATRKHRERIEGAITQLAAKARAAGIHLILATQDPRATIFSPAVKANLDARVCLRTASATQSRMMLEQTGAESLLGRGDLLFRRAGEIVRLQAPLLEDADAAELFGERQFVK